MNTKPNDVWELRDRLSESHELLVQVLETHRGGPAWYQFDPSRGLGEQLSPYCGGNTGLSAILPGRTTLVFADNIGLNRLDWSTRKTESILALDLEHYDLLGLWITATTGQLYYAMKKKFMARAALTSTLQKRGSAIVGRVEPGELYALQPGNGSPQKCADITPSAWRFSVDANRGLLFTVTNEWDLIRTDLSSHESECIAQLSDIYVAGISATPDGALLLWGSPNRDHKNQGIFLLDNKGQIVRRVSEFGHQPSMSPDGTRIAFWTKDALWMASAGRPLEKIFHIGSSSYEAMTFSLRIAWCECGNYLSVSIPKVAVTNSSEWPLRLLSADVARKELAVHNVNPSDYQWKSCRLQP